MSETPNDLVELEDFPDYGVTPDGRVWSSKSGAWCELAQTNNGMGYMKVKVIHRDGRILTRKVHCLIAPVFLGKRPAGMDINHRSGIKADNSIYNLEYMTRSENVLHSIHVLGNKHHGAHLPDSLTPVRAAKRARARRMRRLAYRLWVMDGRCGLSAPARSAMKLTEHQVMEIRAHASARTMTRRAMAKHYKVSRPTVDRIIARTKWAHIA